MMSLLSDWSLESSGMVHGMSVTDVNLLSSTPKSCFTLNSNRLNEIDKCLI